MKFKRILVGTLAMSLFVTPNLTAFAEEMQVQTPTLDSVSVNADQMANKDISSDNIDIDQIISDEEIKEFKGADLGEFSKLQFEVSNPTDSINILNLEYEMLSQKFADMGFGTYAQIEIPEFKTGYSETIVERFNANFGDLTKESELSSELPKELNMTSIMSDSISKRDSLVNEFKDSESYKSIFDNISIGSIFDEASKQKSMPALKSASSLSSIVSSAVSPIKSKNEADKNKAIKDADSVISSFESFDVDKEFNKACEEIDSKIDALFKQKYTEYIDSETDKDAKTAAQTQQIMIIGDGAYFTPKQNLQRPLTLAECKAYCAPNRIDGPIKYGPIKYGPIK